jgi:DNA-binding MarR family transcriptional regulator/GNAT superfamily N-acetyltransferase
MSSDQLAARIEALRRFNRFYTRRIGVLREGLVDSPFSLAEARVLYEVAHRVDPTATELAGALALDAGYLSRLLRGLERQGVLARRRSDSDGRRSHLALTPRGRRAFAALDERSAAEVAAMLAAVPAPEHQRLVQAVETVQRLLEPAPEPRVPYLLRPHRPGDIGWVVSRHGALYAQEYGWDERFEAFVANIAAGFIERFDERRERCWIAERDGENVGSVFLVRKSATVAQLRMLIVEPRARGLGIGRRLVDECERFARDCGYRRIVLWTNSVLHAARRIYAGAGYRLVKEEPHRSFGQALVGQYWELVL